MASLRLCHSVVVAIVLTLLFRFAHTSLVIESCVRIVQVNGITTSAYPSTINVTVTVDHHDNTSWTSNSETTLSTTSWDSSKVNMHCWEYDTSSITQVTYKPQKAQVVSLSILGEGNKYGSVYEFFPNDSISSYSMFEEHTSPFLQSSLTGNIKYQLFHRTKSSGFLKISNRNFNIYGQCWDMWEICFNEADNSVEQCINSANTGPEAIDYAPSGGTGFSNLAKISDYTQWVISGLTTGLDYCWEPYQAYTVFNLTDIDYAFDEQGFASITLGFVGDISANVSGNGNDPPRFWSFAFSDELPNDAENSTQWDQYWVIDLYSSEFINSNDATNAEYHINPVFFQRDNDPSEGQIRMSEITQGYPLQYSLSWDTHYKKQTVDALGRTAFSTWGAVYLPFPSRLYYDDIGTFTSKEVQMSTVGCYGSLGTTPANTYYYDANDTCYGTGFDESTCVSTIYYPPPRYMINEADIGYEAFCLTGGVSGLTSYSSCNWITPTYSYDCALESCDEVVYQGTTYIQYFVCNQPDSQSFPLPVTDSPTPAPTYPPSEDPTQYPTKNPLSAAPTSNPTIDPTKNPSTIPTNHPSTNPTLQPTTHPTINPTVYPTNVPSITPTLMPTSSPSSLPTNDPTSINPTYVPSSDPTEQPTMNPTYTPTYNPTNQPTTQPILVPSVMPTMTPSTFPTSNPSSFNPTLNPTVQPTNVPTSATDEPTVDPTANPASANPTVVPTSMPSVQPSPQPTESPTFIAGEFTILSSIADPNQAFLWLIIGGVMICIGCCLLMILLYRRRRSKPLVSIAAFSESPSPKAKRITVTDVEILDDESDNDDMYGQGTGTTTRGQSPKNDKTPQNPPDIELELAELQAPDHEGITLGGPDRALDMLAPASQMTRGGDDDDDDDDVLEQQTHTQGQFLEGGDPSVTGGGNLKAAGLEYGDPLVTANSYKTHGLVIAEEEDENDDEDEDAMYNQPKRSSRGQGSGAYSSQVDSSEIAANNVDSDDDMYHKPEGGSSKGMNSEEKKVDKYGNTSGRIAEIVDSDDDMYLKPVENTKGTAGVHSKGNVVDDDGDVLYQMGSGTTSGGYRDSIDKEKHTDQLELLYDKPKHPTKNRDSVNSESANRRSIASSIKSGDTLLGFGNNNTSGEN